MESAIPLLVGEVAPAFSLPSTEGRPIGIWDFKQRKNVVLFFFHADCDPCLRALEEFRNNYFRYRSLQAEVLGISDVPLAKLKELTADLSLSFPLLADENGRVFERYGIDRKARVSAVYALDRYNAVERAWVLEERELPDQEDLLATLELSQSRCPE